MASLSELVGQSWRLSPSRMAAHLDPRYQRFPHIEYLSARIAARIAKENARLVVETPPRHGKSWLISKATPAWFLSLWDDKQVILTSYEATFAESWGRQVRDFVQQNKEQLGISIRKDSFAAERWHTDTGGGMVTAGVGGAVTGKGGHLIIVDDPVKNWEEAQSALQRQKVIDWFNSTLYTRAEPGASIIILQTRWHERDLAGYLLGEHTDKWEEIRLPAIAEIGDSLGRKEGEPLCPQRYDIQALVNIKAAVGSRMWTALYQQQPAPDEGNVIKKEWVKRFTTWPQVHNKIIVADLSYKKTEYSDFAVVECWGQSGPNIFLLDQIRARMDFPAQIEAIREMSRRHPNCQGKYIEEAANGAAIISMLRNEILGLIPVKPRTAKEARLAAVSHLYEAGNVWYPSEQLAPWVNDNLFELFKFPNAEHDDTVDCASMALDKLGGLHSTLSRLEAMSRA